MSIPSNCEWCGAPIPSGAKKCEACGQPVRTDTDESSVLDEAVTIDSWTKTDDLPEFNPEPSSTDRWGAVIPSAADDSPGRWGSPQIEDVVEVVKSEAFQSEVLTPEVKKSGKKWIAALVIALVLICACSMGAVLLLVGVAQNIQ